jgi:aspartyl-tRNA(Asn)/glutamyl-tRNA(Gln) amidotransferase subunit C
MSRHFTRADVETVARLARLELAPEEQELFARQLDDILAYAIHIQDVDTGGVPPTSHALVTEIRLRADDVRSGLPRDEAQAAAPAAAHGLFKVPRVLV